MSKFKNRQRRLQRIDLKSFIVVVYDSMRSRTNGHAHVRYKGLEILPRETFYNWALQQEDLLVQYSYWVFGGNLRPLRPTIDRIDSKLGYTIGNIRWLTCRDNSKKLVSN